MSTIFVGAGLARRPLNGGGPWARLQWVLGLRQLGFDTYLVDQIGSGSIVDAAGEAASFEGSLNLAYFRQVIEMFGLQGSAALVYGDGEAIEGSTTGELMERAEAASLLVNIGGKLSWEPLLSRFRRKVYIDIDPAFTQFAGASASGDSLEGYDAYFTMGQNVGTADCPIPADGLSWRPIRQPVVLSEWPASPEGDPSRFTTVAAWRGQPVGWRELGGRTFGLKSDAFLEFVELPGLVDQSFEVALNLQAPNPLLPDGPYPPPLDAPVQADFELMRRHGWRLVDPRVVAPDPFAFRSYVQRSGGEFSAAKPIVVQTQSGSFSDRSACYLASAKPVLLQDTGFGRTLPVGEGLVSFRTLDDAVAGAKRIASDYGAHSDAARAIAEEYFDSAVVLTGMLDEAGVAP
jgi:hypothetical protein